MNESNILIIGANGQLGKALQAKYPGATAVDSNELDISNPAALASYSWSGVTHILNAAAYTNVDGAETTEGRRAAWLVNATAAANLAKISDEHNITLVHISTEYVFDGTSELHTETEGASPLSVYGASKAAGDIAVSTSHKHYILRISWLIGDGKNFVRTMMSLAERNISPTVVHDQVGRLTFTTDLVSAIDHLLTTGANYGIYNLSNSGEPASWADITRSIFQELGRDDLTVTNTTTEEYYAGKEGIAPRPLKSTLDLSKIEAAGFSPKDWKEDLKRYISAESKNSNG